jgi:hypothetical protein
MPVAIETPDNSVCIVYGSMYIPGCRELLEEPLDDVVSSDPG